MIGFRLSAQQPPEPERVNDTVVKRLEHVYEVDPALMQEHIRQHEFPAWETKRIVDGRWDHLDWMHAHWRKPCSPEKSSWRSRRSQTTR